MTVSTKGDRCEGCKFWRPKPSFTSGVGKKQREAEYKLRTNLEQRKDISALREKYWGYRGSDWMIALESALFALAEEARELAKDIE